MIKDAEKNASEDKKRKEFIEVKNKADTLIYSTEKSLKDFADKIAANDKQLIEDAIASLKKAMESEDDLELINQKTEELAAASMKIGEVMYGNKEAESSTQGESPSQNTDDGKVVDGEFKDVSDTKPNN